MWSFEYSVFCATQGKNWHAKFEGNIKGRDTQGKKDETQKRSQWALNVYASDNLTMKFSVYNDANFMIY